MFNYNTVWSWKEYREIYQKAWEFDKMLPPKARKFRILNLSYQYDWNNFSGQKTPDNMAKVFYQGTLDKFRREIIENEVLKKGEKLLALVGTPHAFTK